MTSSVGALEDDAVGHLREAGGDAVAEGGAQLGGGEVGGDEGGEQVLVPVVDEPVGQLLGPLAGLGRTEVVQKQQRAAGQGLQVAFGVVAGTGTQAGVQVGGGDGFPAQADPAGEECPDGAVRLIVLPVPVGPAISREGPSAMPGPLGPGRPAWAMWSAQVMI